MIRLTETREIAPCWVHSEEDRLEARKVRRWCTRYDPQKSNYQLANFGGAPDPPVRRANQNRLIGPNIVPNAQFSTAWKTHWHNAGLIKFANFKSQSSGASWIGSHGPARHVIA
jgi:hypothetical protein